MQIDARTLSTGETIETDVCIVGAGPAGITIAREFLGQSCRVSLLESGGFNPDDAIQSLAGDAGPSIGDYYPGARHMRTRQFGGTANQWNIHMDKAQPTAAQPVTSHAVANLCNLSAGQQQRGVRYVPLDPIDFEQRDWVPYSGWPITKADLDPYYERAHQVCQIGPYSYSAEDWADEQAQPLPFTGERVKTHMFQFGGREVFTEDYRRQIEQSNNITLYLYATVVELETDESTQTVTRARLKHLDGREFSIRARQFILAIGGLETARLLLLSNQQQAQGLGNQHDLVGRFLMDHPLVRSGIMVPPNPQVIQSLNLYDTRWMNGTMVLGKPVLTEATLRREQLLNINAALFPRPEFCRFNPLRMLFPQGKRFRSPAVDAVQATVRQLKQGHMPENIPQTILRTLGGLDDIAFYWWRKQQGILHPYGLDTGGWSRLEDKQQQFGCFEVFHVTEQAPDPHNRVTLGTERDQLGSPKMQLHWRWNEIDIRSARRAQDIFAEEFAQIGLGQLWLERDRGVPFVMLPSIHHHMGTTRMHNNPKQGVVDANCRVHDVPNLFIASSSVFPTGGYANSTLTIIALAIRVADQVKTELTKSHQIVQVS
ncbi:MAG: GMC oxidoreductase [Elainella sp.]